MWWLDVNGNAQQDEPGADVYASFGEGIEHARPVVDDWGDTGVDKIGLYKDGLWLLDLNGNLQFDGCDVDGCVLLGDANSLPVVGTF